MEKQEPFWKFQLVPDIFVDYNEIANRIPGLKVGTQPNLGIVDQIYGDTDAFTEWLEQDKTPWERLTSYVRRLNVRSPKNVSYKILYLTRHGHGVHNEYRDKVGKGNWDDYWARLDGDGTTYWVDAQLTDTGIQQARELGKFWTTVALEQKIPLPETIYTSPLQRCLHTTKIMFSTALKDSGRRIAPMVKEGLRERLTGHTCDKRSTLTQINQLYPRYLVEDGFPEEDRLWSPFTFETTEQHVARKQQVLEDIFSRDPNEVIALTIHAYAIGAIVRACGGEEGFIVREGSTIALLVRGERPPLGRYEAMYY
ncbi:phosphoglycerate mutase family protein [Aspergillus sclerotioniger CBS 115572]|uniref:Phosphoglycerate mutase family protein n=1 Tax=Aspergillus sclerotioniger CBS 115572 TaxID=1450535 RepID=A0A317VEL3_9EURO|nr:phosphoglycerate mutase family protein [Aspergillus sclerotioniger CBS 115572]PWY70320.1 phosphoglycerate mutase family protein [Aspergillus sclerotioniger CBS 115572]